MQATDWDADARGNAELIQQDMPDAERGAFGTGTPGVCIPSGRTTTPATTARGWR